ncbi:transposase [Colletotrichum tofieldiae]|uniref:Transposase n=1 Tax=Colletotrichum tofieldiae TaxID=708197 RepID=A0A166N789_9PEZI|nr:transposase [Colletotrichum tofieldiae]
MGYLLRLLDPGLAISAIQPANRYNIDETGILEGYGANGLVLGRAETKSVRKSSLDCKPGYLLSSVSQLRARHCFLLLYIKARQSSSSGFL